ncbi:MAG: FAD-dependent oxidoreductase [Flavobacteriaceae bacterium]|nr:FAD-dependent oxidoreductase [Flavobacteriaceae bacterium]
MTVDYIIVGLGLAGIAFCETLLENKKTFVVFDTGNNTSSTVAAGLYNPVILKRFTPAWNAFEQIQKALPFYENIEAKLKVKIDYKTPVFRIFNTIEEQNRWFEASDKPVLEHFISPKVHINQNKHIKAEFGFGEVLQSGRIDTKSLLDFYRNYLLDKKWLLEEPFVYTALQLTKPLQYNSIQSKYIVFCEGFGIKNNPFFNQLPLVGNKGELLTIKAPDLKLDVILKSGVFIIPIGGDLYKVGATYNWEDKDTSPTLEAREELLGKLNKIVSCNYEVVSHKAGVRPTVIDRKPLLGQHSEFKNLFVLNGLGTHGVMIGPTAAENLFYMIENGKTLSEEIDIARFN